MVTTLAASDTLVMTASAANAGAANVSADAAIAVLMFFILCSTRLDDVKPA
jgi:hypothetical protein